MVSKFITYSGLILYYGLSTDELPKGVANGSKFTTIDTDEEYWYDRENQGWYDADGQFIPDIEEEGDEIMFVDFSVNQGLVSTDATFADIITAIDSGKYVVARVTTDADDAEMLFPLTQVVDGEDASVIFEATRFDFTSQGIYHSGIAMGENSSVYMNAPLAISNGG